MKRRATSYGVVFLLAIAGLVSNVGCDRCCPDPIQGPPGPIIDVQPNPANGGKIDWMTKDTAAGTPVPQATDGGPIYPNCILRRDFVGGTGMLFNFCLTGSYPGCGSEMGNPKKIRFTNTVANVTITVTKEDGTDRVYWEYLRKVPAQGIVEACTLTQGPVTVGHLPNEFAGLTLIHEVTNPATPTTGTDVQLRIRMLP